MGVPERPQRCLGLPISAQVARAQAAASGSFSPVKASVVNVGHIKARWSTEVLAEACSTMPG
eukprot:15483017-Alexandrium_andersonii.AAC.1